MFNPLQKLSSHLFLRNKMQLLMGASAYVLVACIVGSSLCLLAACSTQNNIVNPPPSPGTWKIVRSQNPGSAQNSLNAIAATSATDAWAVGSFSSNHLGVQGAKALIEHWNGTAWSVVASPPAPLGDSILNGVTALSPTDAWAVGYMFKEGANIGQTLIEHWNGSTWKVVANPGFANGAQLTAIAALSATDMWAVGYGSNGEQEPIEQTLIEHWDGMAWKVIQSPNPGSGFNILNGIAAISAHDIWTAGNFTNGNNGGATGEELFEHWNGTAWTLVQGPNVGAQGNVLSAIAASATNDIWAVGSTTSSSVSQTLIEHWNGSSWITVKGQNPGQANNSLNALTILSPHDIWAVGSWSSAFSGSQAQPLTEHWNGTLWRSVTGPNIGTNTTILNGVTLLPHSSKIVDVGTGANDGTPITVTAPIGNGTTSETPVTAQTLIESCCS